MIGQTLKNYKVEELLGKGGMGVVYRARDLTLDRPVALKVLRPELVQNQDRRRRFMQEAKAASAVQHPAITQVFEIGEAGENTFIAMEYVDGSTVRQLVVRRELDLAAAVEVGIQVGEALGRAHEAGIVHRDIKSENVMLSRDGHPKILDFGLAKLIDPADAEENPGLSRMETVARTQAGMILGTVAYMSPEQARGLPTDQRSDIFSFGILMYEMTAGQVPFQGSSALDTMHAIAYAETQPISKLRADLPFSLQKVIDRCLEKKPASRYQQMTDAVTDLKQAKREIESGVSGGVPVMDRFRLWSRRVTPRGWFWISVAALSSLLLILANVTGPGGFDVGPLVAVLLVGLFIYRWFRNRGQREVRRFVKKATAIKDVQLVAFHKGEFTVVLEHPRAKTYLKLNALLSAANERLFHGDPMTMVIREEVDADEIKRMLTSPGVRFMRDSGKSSGPISS